MTPTPAIELTITTAATTNRSVASDRRASSRTESSPAAAAATATPATVYVTCQSVGASMPVMLLLVRSGSQRPRR